MLPDPDDGLIQDERCDSLFTELWPNDEDTETPEFNRASAESMYIAAKILRAVVYHADYLRREAQRMFVLAEKFERAAGRDGA